MGQSTSRETHEENPVNYPKSSASEIIPANATKEQLVAVCRVLFDALFSNDYHDCVNSGHKIEAETKIVEAEAAKIQAEVQRIMESKTEDM